MTQTFPFRKIYGIPLSLAIVTLAGLLLALFGDGVWDALAVVLLAVPLSLLGWKMLRQHGRPY